MTGLPFLVSYSVSSLSICSSVSSSSVSSVYSSPGGTFCSGCSIILANRISSTIKYCKVFKIKGEIYHQSLLHEDMGTYKHDKYYLQGSIPLCPSNDQLADLIQIRQTPQNN